ncbi:helix-turn-helix domain-containing protein [Clostridioides difficile]|nr:helix-turn-helix domain-containing protein [Clostridioides difficile]
MIGNRIKELRIEKDVTQKELATFLGLTPKMISFYEKEERFPPHDIILKISEFFNVSTDYLLGKSNEREINDFIEKLDSPEDIKNMLKIFTELSEEAQDRMLSIAKVFLEEEKSKK